MTFANNPGSPVGNLDCIQAIKFSNGSGTGTVLSNMATICTGITFEWQGASATKNIGDISITGIQCANLGTCFKFAAAALYKSRITITASQFDGGSGVGVDMDGYSAVTVIGVAWGGAATNNIINTGTGFVQDPTGIRLTGGWTCTGC